MHPPSKHSTSASHHRSLELVSPKLLSLTNALLARVHSCLLGTSETISCLRTECQLAASTWLPRHQWMSRARCQRKQRSECPNSVGTRLLRTGPKALVYVLQQRDRFSSVGSGIWQCDVGSVVL
eukprot:scaffold76160_cov30-Tisochrysis_lutea.AAC.14